MESNNNLLSIKNLKINFNLKKAVLTVVNDVSLQIEKNQKVGLVGESGSGKTVLAHSILKLLKSLR